MSNTRRSSLAAAVVTSSMLMLVAAPVNALAAEHHHDRPGHEHVARFEVNGLVVSTAGSTAVVMARTFADRTGVQHNVSITVTVAPKPERKHHHEAATAGLVTGDQVEMSGTEAGSGDSQVLTATRVVQHELKAHVFVGKVTAVDGTTLMVSKGIRPSDDPGESDHPRRAFGVDISAATVTVDGVAGTVAVGESVVMLGSGYHDTIFAASVFAFTAAPSVLRGEIKAVTGTVVSLNGEDDSQSVVDLAAVPLIINGNPGGDVTTLTEGTKLFVLGTSSTGGTFTATLAFAFDKRDRHPVGGNEGHHQDKHDGQG